MLDEKEAEKRVATAYALLQPCRLCPRACGVDRSSGERGFCGAGLRPAVASAGPHFGEEPCLVGSGGSGTIFLAGCNLGCVFCQNEDISRNAAGGREVEPADLAGLMLGLESRGCENINFVTPTHFAPALMEAIVDARGGGLGVPIVWNCGGYESVEALRLLDGLVEIFMPDFKFSLSASGERYARAADYPARACAAIREMHRQVGDLVIERGVARRGLMVRHLVMPGGVRDGREVLDFLASVSPRTCVNVMGQYRPAADVLRPEGRCNFSAIARTVALQEVAEIREYARRLGLRLVD
jgi:putative pyruvate formate lyase activating enzyme